MKKISFLLTLSIALSAAAAPFVPGKVKVDDFLNVRKGPGLRHPVMGRLLSGADVKILRICDNWLELQAPSTLAVYISEARVNPDGTLNGELNMRIRKDSSSPSFGILPAGTKVQRLDDRANGWVKIVPPETVKVYVAAICVQFDRKAFDEKGMPAAAVEEKTAEPQKTTEAAAEKDVKNETEKDVKAAPAAAPADPAEKASLRGILVKWQFSKTPETAYALLDGPNGKNLAFVIMNDQEKLNTLLNKQVEVAGDASTNPETGIKLLKASSIQEVK